MEYTPLARTALKLAHEIAFNLKPDERIDTDDLVAGVAAQQTSDPARYLRDECGATLARITQTLREIATKDGFAPKRGDRPSGPPSYTASAKEALEAAEAAASARQAQVGLEHILFGLLANPTGNRAFALLSQLNVNTDTFRKRLVLMMDKQRTPASAPARAGKTEMLDKYCTNLNKKATEGKLDPMIGRQKEVRLVEIILGRRNKSNAILIGEAGVGKTAIAEGLAQRIVAGQVKASMRDKVLWTVDLGAMVAGTKYRGEFEERFKALLAEAAANPNLVLVFDEVHTLVGGGGAEGSMDAANLLKPALARGELKCIGATTLKEYRLHIEKDPALNRRFQEVMVGEPTVAETIEILEGLKERYERFHRCKISYAAIKAAAEMSARYIQDRLLPDKAIDLIDEAGSSMSGLPRRNDKDAEIDVPEIDVAEDNDWPVMTEVEIAEVVETHTGIAVSKLTETGKAKLLKMPEVLAARVVGQAEAIEAVSSAMQISGAGLKDPNRPVASLLFCGPTGVGKTELAKALAAYVFDDEEAMIRLDMSEFMEKHSVSRLIGSPPGYVGYTEGGQLTEAIRRKPYSVVLLDEVEKAHPDVFNTLLQVLEDGRLTDSQGRTVDFKHSIIIMTSNAGSKVIMDGGSSAAGLDLGGVSKKQKVEDSYSRIKKLVTEELKQLFRPEFLNRMDKVVVFRPLEKEELRLIIDLLIVKFGTLLVQHNLTLELSAAAEEHILNDGYDRAYGARPIRRAIEGLVNGDLAKLILAEKVKAGDHLIADITESGETTFRVSN
jgi:ATP-dependent Clp protease ATP-binding subunit ClpC